MQDLESIATDPSRELARFTAIEVYHGKRTRLADAAFTAVVVAAGVVALTIVVMAAGVVLSR